MTVPQHPLYWPLSAHLKDRIKDSEGLSLKAYLCPAKVPTIGWGATGRGVILGLTWTLAQCEARFEADLWEVALGVTQLLNGRPASVHQFEALVSFAFNVGLDIDKDTKAEGLGDSTLLKKHLAGDYEGARKEFSKWVFAGKPPKKLPGLWKRRVEEANWYALSHP